MDRGGRVIEDETVHAWSGARTNVATPYIEKGGFFAGEPLSRAELSPP